MCECHHDHVCEEAIHVRCMDEIEKALYAKHGFWLCPYCVYSSESDDYDSENDSEEEEAKSVIVPPVPPRAASVDQNLRAL